MFLVVDSNLCRSLLSRVLCMFDLLSDSASIDVPGVSSLPSLRDLTKDYAVVISTVPQLCRPPKKQ